MPRVSNKFTRVLCLTACIFGLSACGNSDPYVLGFIGGLSGRVADLGIAGRNGVLLAVEEQNRSGGINGRKVLLEIRDDQQDEAAARAGVNELIAMDAAVIIGHMTSSMSVKTVPLMNEKRIVLLSPTTTTQQLTGIDDYFIRVIRDTAAYGERNAKYRYVSQGLRRIVIVYDTRNAAYTESWLHSFKTSFEKLGGKVLKAIPFRSGDDVHFSQLAEQMLIEKPDSIQIITGAMDAALLIQQIRKVEPDLPVATSEWAATEKLIELGSPAVEGVVMAQFFDRDSPLPHYQQFKKMFEKRFSHPPGFAEIAGYDAATVAMRALAQQRSDEDLKQTIIRIGSFPGAQGTVNIDRFGDAIRETYVTKIENGTFKLIQ